MIKKDRNVGIELLRIVSMFGIMVLHVLGQGGILGNAAPMSATYETAWALEIICYIGVTVYALISGYVSVQGNYRVTNIIYLYLQVLFYNLIAYIFFLITRPESYGINGLMPVLFPVSTESYWYFSAYFPLFFLIPAIKTAINKLPRIYLNIILGIIVVLWTIIPVFIHTDVFALRGGSSFIWLLSCFYIGAYMKKFELFANVKSVGLWLIYAATMILTFASKFVIELVLGISDTNPDRANILIAYNSPTILLSSMVILVLFGRIKIEGKASKYIKLVAPLTFGVYLSNCQPFVWRELMKDRFVSYASMPAWLMAIMVVLSALVIFLIGIAIDGLRFVIYELGHLKEKLFALEIVIMKEKCPCCGKTRVEKYEICEVCGWENDPTQALEPDLKGGANKDSLNEHREKFTFMDAKTHL